MSGNGYMSHLVLLSTLARIVSRDVAHVVELGCGFFSTSMLLNRNIWPFVHSVISYEHSPEWSRYIEYITRDPRLTFMDEMPFSISLADLVLIDNGDNRADRIKGIRHVIECDAGSLIVLHDANEREYMQAIEPHFENCIVYTGAYPHTAILWNGDRWDYDEIKACMKVAETYECLQLT